MTRACLVLALALGEGMGPHGTGTSFVEQKARDVERQLHHLGHASEMRHPSESLLQEHSHAHNAHRHTAHAHHMAHAHAHGKHRAHEHYLGAGFQQQVSQIADTGSAEVMDGLKELRDMPDPAKAGLSMKALDAQAAKSNQELNSIMKQDTAAPKAWVDDTQETIAKSELKVQNTIKNLEHDFYSSLAQGGGNAATSLLEDGKNPGSLMQAEQVQSASERRALALNQEVQAAARDFDKDFAAGMAQGFQAAKAKAAVAVGADGAAEHLRAH